MNTLYTTHVTPSHDWPGRMASIAARWVAAADHWIAASLERNRQSEQERYLARASDLYELESLQRDWDRRRRDTWTAL